MLNLTESLVMTGVGLKEGWLGSRDKNQTWRGITLNGCDPSHAYKKQFLVELLTEENERTLPLQSQTCFLCRVKFGGTLCYALSCSHLQATLQRLPTAMTPTYPEGFIQIVPFAPFAAEILKL